LPSLKQNLVHARCSLKSVIKTSQIALLTTILHNASLLNGIDYCFEINGKLFSRLYSTIIYLGNFVVTIVVSLCSRSGNVLITPHASQPFMQFVSTWRFFVETEG